MAVENLDLLMRFSGFPEPFVEQNERTHRIWRKDRRDRIIREDLSTSHDSITRWLRWFQDLYIHFEIKPWSKNIKRSLKKEGKI